MLNIELRAARNNQPGHGELVIHGWERGSETLEITIQRNQDGRYLDPDGRWETAPVRHALGEVREHEGALLTDVGPWLVDPLLAGTGMSYQFTFKNAEGEGRGVLNIKPGLLSSAAAGQSHSNETTAVHAAVPLSAPEADTGAATDAETPAPPEPEPAPAADTDTDADAPTPALAPRPAPEKKSRWWLWLLLGVLLLALIGAALWWFLLRPSGDSGTEADAGDTSPCGAGSMAQTSDDLLFIRTCLATQPSSQEVLEVIAAAKAAKRCNLVQRLYAHKAQAGDVEVALAYAREYDPHSFSGGCIEAADADTAVYWYEIVTEHAPDNPEAQQRLQELNR